MNRTMELIEKLSVASYRSDYQKAKARKKCILCQNPALDFRNASGRLEYSVSAICQECQDGYFNK